MLDDEQGGGSRRGHVLFLIDASASMHVPRSGTAGLDIAYDAMSAIIEGLVDASSARDQSAPRSSCQLALILYDEVPQDVYNGFVDLSVVHARDGKIRLATPTTRNKRTDMLGGFEKALHLLAQIRPRPTLVPIICHITDGFVTHTDGQSPEIVPHILNEMIGAHQGIATRVLIAHLFVSDQVLRVPMSDVTTWPGILWEHDLQYNTREGLYARLLFRTASLLPPETLPPVCRAGFRGMKSGARLLFPAMQRQLVRAVVASVALGGPFEFDAW